MIGDAQPAREAEWDGLGYQILQIKGALEVPFMNADFLVTTELLQCIWLTTILGIAG